MERRDIIKKIGLRITYDRLRRGAIGSRLVYRFLVSFYRMATKGTPYLGTTFVEIPWVLRQLREYTHGGEKVLQVGDVLLKKALDKYEEVVLVDMNAEEYTCPRLKIHQSDIRDDSLPKAYFDIAIAISTIEHIGNQGLRFPDGDILATELISEALKVNGLFFLTLPFSNPEQSGGGQLGFTTESTLT